MPCAGCRSLPQCRPILSWLPSDPKFVEPWIRREKGGILWGDRRCWGRRGPPVCSPFWVSYRKLIVHSKAKALLPLCMSYLAAGSLLEKNPQRGAWNKAVSLRHICVYVHTHARTSKTEPKGVELPNWRKDHRRNQPQWADLKIRVALAGFRTWKAFRCACHQPENLHLLSVTQACFFTLWGTQKLHTPGQEDFMIQWGGWVQLNKKQLSTVQDQKHKWSTLGVGFDDQGSRPFQKFWCCAVIPFA